MDGYALLLLFLCSSEGRSKSACCHGMLAKIGLCITMSTMRMSAIHCCCTKQGMCLPWLLKGWAYVETSVQVTAL